MRRCNYYCIIFADIGDYRIRIFPEIFAFVTLHVLVYIGMLCIVDLSSGAARSFMPVVRTVVNTFFAVVSPLGAYVTLVITELIFTNVANAVNIIVRVSGYFYYFGFGCMLANLCVPVIGFIGGPFLGEVEAELSLTRCTHTVVVSMLCVVVFCVVSAR